MKRKITELNFLLQVDASGLERLVHHNKLKPYEGDHPPSWKESKKKIDEVCRRSLINQSQSKRKVVYFILFLILIVYN